MQNVSSGLFRVCSTRPLWTFVPGQCIPPSTIMQFRRIVYEYSTKKLCLMQSEREQTLAIQTHGWPTQLSGTKFNNLTGIVNFVKLSC